MRHLLMVMLCLAAAACGRSQAPPPAPPPASIATPPPVAAAAAAPKAPAVAGDFAGTLPCADCAGIKTELSIAADGSYVIRETLQGKSDAVHEEKGQSSASEDGRRLQLAAEDSEDARYFEIISPDELRMLDSTGNPIADTAANYSLKRKAPAAP
jgi:copper homeostasis protein (lipoprotein)